MAASLLGLLAVFAVPAAGALFPDCANGPLKNNTVCDTSASVADRARALVNAFTLEEKFNLTGNTSPGVPRLGLYPYQWWQEALHGVASSPGVSFATQGDYSYATSFPQPILMGAAFDDALINAVATVVSTEARAFNNANRSGLDFWTPNINPYKDPRWGRGQETPGEDPFHLKSYVAALINGLQGGKDPKYKKIIATCKHFVAYDLEDWESATRYNFDAQVTTQDLAEYYMQPFQTCARDANVGSIMCSYNALNGVPTCADPYILQDVLRDHWNWTGEGQYVTSDCDAVQNVFMPHDYTTTREQTVADSLLAGTDLNCGTYYQTFLPTAYSQGLFNQTTIDQTLIRLYSSLIKLGYFDPASATPYRSLGFQDVSTPSSLALAKQAAAEGMVLLKNNGVLPLNLPANTKTNITMFGEWVNVTTQLQGNYAGVAKFLHAPLYSLQQLSNVNVRYTSTVGYIGFPTTGNWPGILSASDAPGTDYIIIADGINTDDESESNDRYAISWSPGKVDMITQVATLGIPIILLQFGDQLDSAPFLNHPNISAIIWGGYPGQAGGDALVDILTGKTSPAGRLPVTQYPADYVNQVAMTDMNLRPNASSGNPGRTYKWFNNATLPFGYGLHYTNFSTKVSSSAKTMYNISSLMSSCDKTKYPYMDLCPMGTVEVNVTNTGSVTSDFVTLAFVSSQNGPKPYPIKELVAYQRLFNVTGHSSQMAMLNLTLGSIARRDENGNQILYPGDYGLLIDVPTQTTFNFTLMGSPVTLDQWPQRPAQG